MDHGVDRECLTALRARERAHVRGPAPGVASPAPRTGTEAAAASDPELDDYLHTYLANRGVLLTPFHNMALVSPVTTAGDVDKHTQTFNIAIGELLET
jgi:glutamate-1-semialdehyde aminotransferase